VLKHWKLKNCKAAGEALPRPKKPKKKTKTRLLLAPWKREGPINSFGVSRRITNKACEACATASGALVSEEEVTVVKSENEAVVVFVFLLAREVFAVL